MLSVLDLERVLGLPCEELVQRAALRYRPLKIKKRDGGTRTVLQPHEDLKAVQRALLAFLANILATHNAATARRGPLANAQRHAGSKVMISCDIRDFYDHVRKPALHAALSPVFRSPACDLICMLTTQKGCLVQGAPTSALLADVVCRKLDEKLAQYAATYTRFADDITFSAQDEIDLPQVEDIEAHVAAFGFQLNQLKTIHADSGTRMCVTGHVITPSAQTVPVRGPKEQWRRLRTGVNALKHKPVNASWWVFHEQMTSLAGHLGQGAPERAEPYKKQLRKLREDAER
jgi:RNA-directed DNA polymerase